MVGLYYIGCLGLWENGSKVCVSGKPSTAQLGNHLGESNWVFKNRGLFGGKSNALIGL